MGGHNVTIDRRTPVSTIPKHPGEQSRSAGHRKFEKREEKWKTAWISKLGKNEGMDKTGEREKVRERKGEKMAKISPKRQI